MKKFRFETIIVHTVLILLITVINYGGSASVPNEDDFFTINITMTNIMTVHEDQYAYVQYKLPDEELMIVGYTPLTEMNVAHHMLTYACAQPASTYPFWIDGSSCAGEQMFIHGWARNAPPLTLPKDVGFAVGRNTPYKYIVVNIHYLAIVKGDNSGNQLLVSRKPRKYRAGVLLGASGGIVLSAKTETIRVPFSCQYNGPPISIFAVRVHAHQWARVNSLYRVRNGKISQIVKSNPQWPQSFYPLSSAVNIQSGDTFVGQCVYDNNETRVIYAGSTHHDEMCNVYSMYSYDPAQTSGGIPPIQACWGDSVNGMFSLMPPDSVIAPAKPSDISGTEGAEHSMKLSKTDLFTNIDSWPDVKSLPSQLGQIGGIALNNANDELVVFHRGSRKWEPQYFDGYRFRNEVYGPIEEDVLIHIDTQTGQVKSRWGAKMFYLPHGLTIDHQGNYWLTDIAMHQIFMFKPNNLTHPALTVGDKFQWGSNNNHFCRPADVAVMENGDFFVADGYCNNRIIKFNKNGIYLMQWGFQMTGRRNDDGFPPPYEWNIVHSIALNEKAQLLCGADRENSRIQCFHSNTGNFVRQIHVEKAEISSAIYAIEFAPNVTGVYLFAVTGGAQTLKKKVYLINAETGDSITSFNAHANLLDPHDITVSKHANEIYVGELASSPTNALHKFERSMELPTPSLIQSLNRRILLNIRNMRIHLTIFAAICLLASGALLICLISQIRKQRRYDRLNKLVVEEQNNRTEGGSRISNWFNRQKHVERLEQVTDEENQLLESDEDSQSSDPIVGNDIITIKSKQKPKTSNYKHDPAKFKMGSSL